MTIDPYTQYTESEILPLYRAVGWSNCYENPLLLRRSFEHSLCTLAAYRDDQLVGILRAVGDGYSIVFIQDLLVLPQYQRQGIGTALMEALLARYPHVYQMELATDNTEKTCAFYRSLDFQPMEEIGCRGFIRMHISK